MAPMRRDPRRPTPRRRGPAGLLRPSRPPGQRRVELHGRVHAPGRPLRPVSARRLGPGRRAEWRGRRSGRRAASAGRLGRLAPAAPAGPEAEKSDFDDAMGHVIEAFRFLHARVSTLEARIATEDVPLDGAAWLAPARELGRLGRAGGGARRGPHARRRGRPRRLWRRRPRPRASPSAARPPAASSLGARRAAGPRTRLRRDDQRGQRVPGDLCRGLARRPRPQRRGRPPAAPRASCRCSPRAGGPWRPPPRSSSCPRHPPLGLSTSTSTTRPGRTRQSDLALGICWRARSIARPGACSSTAAGSSTSAALAGPVDGDDQRFGVSATTPLHVSGVHHFVPVLHRGDAVGRHTLRLRDATRARGLELEHLRRRRPGRDRRGHAAGLGLSGRGRAGRRRRLPVRHRLADGALAGRSHRDAGRELPQRHPARAHGAVGPPPGPGPGPRPEDLAVLAPRTTLAVADSAYNETHLAEAGFAATAVVAPSAALRVEPIDAPGGARHRHATERRTEESQDTQTDHVARRRPGLAEQVPRARHRRPRRDPARRDPDRHAPHRRQAGHRRLRAGAPALRRRLGLLDAVTFAGHATDAAVAEAYATSDVLVVTSEHEGFCVPVVEAMAAGLPVVAFDQGAIPEVLGDAGRPRHHPGPLRGGRRHRRPAGRRRPPRRPGRAGANGGSTSSTCPTRRSLRRSPRPPLGRSPRRQQRTASPPMRTAIHQFVPMLHRDDAVGRHTLRIRDVLAAAGHSSRRLRRDDRSRDRGGDQALPALRRRRPAGRRPALPIRHRLDHRPLAGRPPRDAGRQLPQRHAARVLRRLEQPDGPPPAPGAPRAHGDLAPRTSLAIAVSRFNEAELHPPATPAPPSSPRPPSRRRRRRHRRHRRDRHGPDRRQRAAGSASAGSPPTRASSSPSWPCSSPTPTTTRRHARRSWAGPSCPPTPGPSSASSTSSASADAVTFRGRSATTTWSRAMAAVRRPGHRLAARGFRGAGHRGHDDGPARRGEPGRRPARDRRRRRPAGRRHRPLRPGRRHRAGPTADPALRRALEDKAAQRVAALDLPTAGDRTVDLIAAL